MTHEITSYVLISLENLIELRIAIQSMKQKYNM